MSEKKDEKKKRVVQKYNLNEVDDLWGSGLADTDAGGEDDLYGLGDLLSADDGSSGVSLADTQDLDASGEQYGGEDFSAADSYPQDDFVDLTSFDSEASDITGEEDLAGEGPAEGAPEGAAEEEQAAEEVASVEPEVFEFAAQLEYIGGMRLEVDRARLFAPDENSILLIDTETGDEVIVFFEQLTCLRLAGLPAGITEGQKESCISEVIETVDGVSHQVRVCARQKFPGLLCCFSPEEEQVYPATLFPKASIRRRTQDRQLTDILLEKRLISKSILKRASQEYGQLKGMPFEKILAQRARIPLATIEAALDQARENKMLGMKTGEILLISGIASEEQILGAIEYHERIQHLEFDQFLIDRGFVNEVEMYIALAEKHRIPFVDLRQRKIPRESLSLLPEKLVVEHDILPLVKKDDVLLVAAHVVDMSPLHDAIVSASACKDVKYVLSPPSQLRKIISMVYRKNS